MLTCAKISVNIIV